MGSCSYWLSGFGLSLGIQFVLFLLDLVLLVSLGLLLLLDDFLGTSFALEDLAAEEFVLSLLLVGS